MKNKTINNLNLKNKKFLTVKLGSLFFGIGACICLAMEKTPLIFACAAMAVILSFAAHKVK